MSKLQLKATCRESDLLGALHEAKAIMKACEYVMIEIKVMPNEYGSADHKYVMITNESSPADIMRIYSLEKELETAKKTVNNLPE